MSESPALPEPRANELVRRLDWRFLVPLEQIERVHYRSEEWEDLPMVFGTTRPGPVDLAVLASPGLDELREAFALVRPGGSVYAQWRRPVPGGATRLVRRVRKAGFVEASCHWPWPWARAAGPAFWVPLGERRPLDLVLARRVPRSLIAVARVVFNAMVRLGLIGPLCVIASRPGRAQRPHASSAPEARSLLLLTGGRRSVNKAVGLFMLEAEATPAVVKFARSPSEDAGLRREFFALRHVEAERPRLPGVPRPLFLACRAGRAAVGETAMPGRPLLERADPQRFRPVSDAVTAWLVELAGRGPAARREEWWSELVDAPVAEFARLYGRVVGAEELRRARAALERLPDLPLVCEHRDFSPWNVLEDGAMSLAVLDWESAEPQGLPALDLTYFLTLWAAAVEGALDTGFLDAYRRSRGADTFTGAVVTACEARYCAGVGLAPDVLPTLRLLCWTIHALSEHRRHEQDVAGPPDPRVLAAGPFLRLWREELDRQRVTACALGTA